MIIDDKLQSSIDTAINSFDGSLQEVFVEVRRIISEWIITNNIDIRTSLEFDKAFNDALTQAGYYDLVNEFVDKDYNQMFGLIQDGFAIGGINVAFNTIDLEKIMALKALDINKFSVLASTAGTSLRESLVKYAMSNYTKLDMVRELQTEFEGTNLFKHSKTIADSAITQFHQSVINIKAADIGDLVWVYRGKAIDGKTRDFCKCIINAKKYYDSSDKATLENNSKRKYNCRHWFNAVTVDYAKSSGFTFAEKVTCN